MSDTDTDSFDSDYMNLSPRSVADDSDDDEVVHIPSLMSLDPFEKIFLVTVVMTSLFAGVFVGGIVHGRVVKDDLDGNLCPHIAGHVRNPLGDLFVVNQSSLTRPDMNAEEVSLLSEHSYRGSTTFHFFTVLFVIFSVIFWGMFFSSIHFAYKNHYGVAAVVGEI